MGRRAGGALAIADPSLASHFMDDLGLEVSSYRGSLHFAIRDAPLWLNYGSLLTMELTRRENAVTFS